MSFEIPCRGNERLKQLVERVNADPELLQMWKNANINAVDRCGISDHGEVHIRIVTHAALKILRLLAAAGVKTNIVKDHGLTADDAEVIVVLAACLHDLGISVHRDGHEQYSLWIAYPKSRQLLTGIYAEPALTVMVTETLHAIVAHAAEERCLTIEAGVLKVADATDMTHGRSRIPFQAGVVNIHSVSAQAVNALKIEAGEKKPIRLAITLGNSARIFQVDELLRDKLRNSSIGDLVEVAVLVEGETERRVITGYTF